MLMLADAGRYGISRGSTLARQAAANILDVLMDNAPVDAQVWRRLMFDSANAADEMLDRLLLHPSSLAWMDLALYEASLALDALAMDAGAREEEVA